MGCDRVVDVDGLGALAARQHGTFSLQDLRDLGVSTAAIRHRVAAGRWTRELPRVYGLVGHHQSWERRLWIAHLNAGPDSVIATNSAARLQGAAEAFADRIELLVPGNRGKAPPGVRWQRTIDLVEDDIVRVDGLPPMTTPARTAVDLAGWITINRLRRFVESGVLERRFTLIEVGAVLGRVRRSGKPGVTKLCRVLDDLGPGDGLTRSELERLGDGVIRLAGLPAPVREHPLPNERGRRGFVDRCWPDAKLIVEFDGRKWHDRNQQRLADADRRLEAQSLGYETSQILWEHASGDRDRTATLLSTIHRQRLLLLRQAR